MKIGDKVKCIRYSDVGFFGKVGKIYTITHIDHLGIKVEGQVNMTQNLLKDRFIVIEKVCLSQKRRKVA